MAVVVEAPIEDVMSPDGRTAGHAVGKRRVRRGEA
jgi:hypothetical protein